jgi:hypothetical protein
VTKTHSQPTTIRLSGARSAHAVEPAGPLNTFTKTGDFAAAGSDTQAAASLSADYSRRPSAYPTFDRCVVEGGRLIEP